MRRGEGQMIIYDNTHMVGGRRHDFMTYPSPLSDTAEKP